MIGLAGSYNPIMNDSNNRHENGIPIIRSREMEFVRYLASGGMAEVSLYKWKRENSTHILVAMKSLVYGPIEDRFKPHLRHEMAILAKLEHENIVQTFGVVQTDRTFGLVMEYFPFGSYLSFFGNLWGKIKRTDSLDRLMVPIKIQILCEVISAMKYLHGIRPRKVLHLDLKSDNVLLDDGLHAKICDFGLSTMNTLTDLRSRSLIFEGPCATGGTPGYISPERLQNIRAKPTTKADVYSFAILMWEIMSDKLPFSELVTSDYHSDDSEEQRPDISLLSPVFPAEMTSIVRSAWACDPKTRPSFKELDEMMLSIKGRIPHYKEQVKESRIQVLRLHMSTIEGPSCSMPTHLPCSVSIHSSTRDKQQGCKEHICSISDSISQISLRNPGEETLPKRFPHGTVNLAPRLTRHSPDNKEHTPLMHSFLDISSYKTEANFDQHSIQSRSYDAEKKMLKPAKILLVLVILTVVVIGICVAVWLATKDENYKCTKIEGVCSDWYEHKCIPGYKAGLCSGDASIQCCPPCDAECQKTESRYNDTACDNILGICQDKSNFCSQKYIKGKCQGPGDRLCCPPNPADENCTKRGGICINWKETKCTAGYRSGFCTGSTNIRCCLPCDAACQAAEDVFQDPDCDSLDGTCMDYTNYCPDKYIAGKCDGPDTRQCCPSYQPKHSR